MEISDEENITSVDLGFAEKTESWKLRSEFFKSKIGGKPAWLNLSNVPTCDMILCGKCQNPCIFLCQIYAPIEDNDDCFHRTLFIFTCPSHECCLPNDAASFKVLRCQLGRRNNFFSFHPPIESENFLPEVTAEKLNKLCQVCNIKSTFHCGKCQTANYCSRQHQVLDWKAGHKAECTKPIEGDDKPPRPSPLLLPEWELVTESEPLENEEIKPEKSNDERLQEFQNLVKSGQAGTLHGDAAAEAELQEMPENIEDAVFKKFKHRISCNAEQVLRYEREGQPLWVSEQEPSPVAPCQLCGSPRVFECQILPQMLNCLGLDQVGHSIDWGTLAIFTCKRSCGEGLAYKEEVLIKQDFAK